MKMWCGKDLEGKRKLRYYKEVINPNIEGQNYLCILTSLKKKIHIAKIRTNSHEVHSETWCWTFPKNKRAKRICNIYETLSVDDEIHFLPDWISYTHVRSQFQIF